MDLPDRIPPQVVEEFPIGNEEWLAEIKMRYDHPNGPGGPLTLVTRLSYRGFDLPDVRPR
jgi:hypothetical protein